MILWGDDSAAATMLTALTFNVGYSGATAAADGDSYVTFTETITFDTATPVLDQSSRDGKVDFGGTAARTLVAQPFAAIGTGTLTEVRVWLDKVGAPTDNVVLEIQTDSSGSPSGSVVGTVATVAGSSLTTTITQYTYSTSIALTASTTYWLVLKRSGSADSANVYEVGYFTSVPGGWTSAKGFFASWTSLLGGTALTVRLTFAGATTTLYLTDTASAVSTASVDREAWTSRGAGVQTDVTNTTAGWTAPIQMTDTAGGTVVDWFTKPLQAVTLGGLAVANLRALESNALANASPRCQVARVDNDGTNATVWATGVSRRPAPTTGS